METSSCVHKRPFPFSPWDFCPVTEEFHVQTSAALFCTRLGEVAARIGFYSGAQLDGFRADGRDLFLTAPHAVRAAGTGVITVMIGG